MLHTEAKMLRIHLARREISTQRYKSWIDYNKNTNLPIYKYTTILKYLQVP